jgi:hypothetical protein
MYLKNELDGTEALSAVKYFAQILLPPHSKIKA